MTKSEFCPSAFCP